MFLGSTVKPKALGSSEILINNHGSIPIYGVAQSTIRQLTQASNSEENQPALKEIISEKEESKEDEYQVSRYVDSKSFNSVPSNAQFKELAIFSITGLTANNIGISETEQSLNIILGEVAYKWFVIEGLDDSDSIVFVKVFDENYDAVFDVLKRVNLLKTDLIKVDLQSGLREYLNDYLKIHPELQKAEESTEGVEKEEKEEDEEPVIKELKQFIKSLKTKKLSQSSKPLDDLDYVIDENELKGIPEEYLPQLTKDIKEFRLNVIKIEKQKKATEKREAIKRNKEQLKLLYKQFSNGELKEEDEDDDEDEEDDDEGLTDEQYEARKQQQKSEKIAKLYNTNLLKVKGEEKQNLELIKQLKEAQDYELTLEKFKTQREANDEQYRAGNFKYSKGLLVTREMEAKKDTADRVQEAEESPNSGEDQPMEDTDVVEEAMQEGEEEETIITDSILQISSSKLMPILEALKPKFNRYVIKYLEMEDEEMVDFIVTMITDLKDKTKIIEELSGAFEEHGPELGDSIWKDLHEAISK